MKVTVILTCWKRFENFEKIIKAWLNEEEVDEILIWDNSGTFKTELPVTVFNSNLNLGSSVRYMLGAIAKNDYILFCDDDVLPHKGITNDFIKYASPEKITAVTGRFFKGSYHNNEVVRATDVKDIVKVDFVIGYLMMIHRNLLLGFNYRTFPWHCCELYLEGLNKDRSTLHVIPTDKFTKLPEGEDDNALYRQPAAFEEKEEIYRRFFG